MNAQSLPHRVLEWLRAGYPDGIPGPDRVPMLSLLRNTPLSESELKEVVREVAAAESAAAPGHGIDHDEIEHFIEGVAHHPGNPEDIRRVAAKLAAAGWPLESFDA
jgi:hypothetical protein